MYIISKVNNRAFYALPRIDTVVFTIYNCMGYVIISILVCGAGPLEHLTGHEGEVPSSSTYLTT